MSYTTQPGHEGSVGTSIASVASEAGDMLTWLPLPCLSPNGLPWCHYLRMYCDATELVLHTCTCTCTCTRTYDAYAHQYLNAVLRSFCMYTHTVSMSASSLHRDWLSIRMYKHQ